MDKDRMLVSKLNEWMDAHAYHISYAITAASLIFAFWFLFVK